MRQVNIDDEKESTAMVNGVGMDLGPLPKDIGDGKSSARIKLEEISRLAMTWWKERKNDVWIDSDKREHDTYADGPPEFLKIAASVLGEKL